VIALSRQFSVGVDVEHVRPDIPHQDIAKRFFSDRDNQWLQRRPAPESTDFFRLWVIKEAFVKCIGLGLSFPLEDCEVNFVDSRCHGIRWLGHEEHEFSVTELKLWEGFTSALVIQQSL
jgi:4'-phosphopantetheinyl transferase